MWVHLCTSSTGHMRAPNLKDHFKQNNDFLKMIYPEKYLPEYMRLRIPFRILRFFIAVPILMLTAVALLNTSHEREVNEICKQRKYCLTECEQAVFPFMTCGISNEVSFDYNGNFYNRLYTFKYSSTKEFEDCREYTQENSDYSYSNVDTNRQ